MSEQIEKIIDINDDILDSRIQIIKEQLTSLIEETRKNIDETKPSTELVNDINFKSWVINNEVLKMISSNENFARLFYFMHGHFGGDIDKVLKNYDVEFNMDEQGNLIGINLITLEEEYE